MSCIQKLTKPYAFLATVLLFAGFAANAWADPLPGRDTPKFSQLPMINTPIVDPNGTVQIYQGHDELSTVYGFRGIGPNDLPQSYTGRFMADDFADKLSSPVVHVKWWGSYFRDIVAEPLNKFLISFESDQPADADNPFSHPDQPLLNQVVTRAATLTPGSGTFTEKLIRGPDPILGESLYEYNAELHLDKSFPEKADTVYWLKIAAMIDVFPGFDNFDPLDPLHPPLFTGNRPTAWGWHNRDYTMQNLLASTAVTPGEVLDGTIGTAPVYHFQDDAVAGILVVNPLGPGGRVMPSITQTEMLPQHYRDFADGPGGTTTNDTIRISDFSKDLAFELYTVPEPASCLLLLMGLCITASPRQRGDCRAGGRRIHSARVDTAARAS